MRLASLFAGLLLGAGAAWGLHQHTHASSPRAKAASSAAASPSPAAPVSRPAGLVLPPRLAPEEADAALDAWITRTPLPANASPAEYNARADALRALLTVLPTAQFERLLAVLGTRLGEAERRLRWIAFDVWLERDAPAAARWAVALVPSEAINAGARSRYAAKALLAWSEADFSAAYAWATALPEIEFARSLASKLLAGLASTEPVRALALAQAGGPELLRAAQSELFRAWADHDPAAAVLALGPALLEANKTEWYVQEALGKWTARDPRGALDWICGQAGPGPDKTRHMLRLLTWNAVGEDGKTDPRPFAEALASRTDLGGQLELLSSLLWSWSAKAPDAALAWLDSLPDAARRADLLERATNNYFPDNPERNLPLALHLPPGTNRDSRVATILGNWASADPDAALAWLRDHDDPSLAGAAARVQGTLVGALAATDPAAALARWQELPDGEARSAAVPVIAKAWARTDPAAASRWLATQTTILPQLQAYRPETLTSTVSAWLKQDPSGALQWIESPLDSSTRRAALDALPIPRYFGDADTPNRSSRADLIAQIRDPALRSSVLSMHLDNWIRSDLPAAREWIETHDALSPEQAAQILANAGVATP